MKSGQKVKNSEDFNETEENQISLRSFEINDNDFKVTTEFDMSSIDE